MSCGSAGCTNEATDVLEVVIPPDQIPEGMESFDRSIEYCSGCAQVALLNGLRGVEHGSHPAFRWLRKVDWDA